jgi:hypothetical protein
VLQYLFFDGTRAEKIRLTPVLNRVLIIVAPIKALSEGLNQMAHEIDMTNGRANIAFMGNRNDVWHRLGQEMKEGMTIAPVYVPPPVAAKHEGPIGGATVTRPSAPPRAPSPAPANSAALFS